RFPFLLFVASLFRKQLRPLETTIGGVFHALTPFLVLMSPLHCSGVESFNKRHFFVIFGGLAWLPNAKFFAVDRLIEGYQSMIFRRRRGFAVSICPKFHFWLRRRLLSRLIRKR